MHSGQGDIENPESDSNLAGQPSKAKSLNIPAS